jgi:hypothetical protein
MNPGQQSSDPEKPDDGLLSPEEFNEWMKDPANAEKFCPDFTFAKSHVSRQRPDATLSHGNGSNGI